MESISELQTQIQNLNKQVSELLGLLRPTVKESGYTLFSWLDTWYEIYKKPKLAKNGSEEIENCIRNHIKPHMNDIALELVTGIDIQKVLNEIQAGRTRKYTYYVFFGALKQAQRLKLISDNPIDSVDPIKHKYKTGKALSKEEQHYFMGLLDKDPYRPIFAFYFLSGCRRCEATALFWSDIDYENKRIHIRGTKTESSDRYIPLFPEIEKLLKPLSRKSETVFGVTWNAVSCKFKRMQRQYHFTFRLHDFRHTFATRCLENGISMKTIQKWLGHSRIDITSNIYTHVTTAFEKEEIQKFHSEF